MTKRIIAALLLAGALQAQAATIEWTGETSTNWNDANNWDPVQVPVAGDDVVFRNSPYTVPCYAGRNSVSNNLASITIRETYGSTVLFESNAVLGGMNLTLTGDLTVKSGELKFIGAQAGTFGTGWTVECANAEIYAGASMNSDNGGFRYLLGPSPGSVYGGASHGGQGPVAWTNTVQMSLYGSPSGPASLGSGGGNANSGPGGGAIRLKASGNVIVNGMLSCRATNSPLNASGASGGSIWIDGGTLSGTGVVTCAGGAGSASLSGGGGGRLDISGTANNFAGLLLVNGGNGRIKGNAGSLLLPQSSGTGYTLDNFYPVGPSNFMGYGQTFGTVWVTNGARLWLSSNTGAQSFAFTTLVITNGGIVYCNGNVGAVNAADGGTSINPYGEGVTLLCTNLTIAAGGTLSARLLGFPSALGPGRAPTRDFGACHGGLGSNWRQGTNYIYGSISNPVALGSGGGGVFGGGAIKIVAGTMTCDGTNTVNGEGSVNQSTSCGGSIWIDAGTLSGAGVITATSEKYTGSQPGGGSGGRIAIVYDTMGSPAIQVGSNVQAYGGASSVNLNKGAAGTIFIQQRGQPGTLWVNNDIRGTNCLTPLLASSFNSISNLTVIVTNAGEVRIEQPCCVAGLWLGSTSSRLDLTNNSLQVKSAPHSFAGSILNLGRLIWEAPQQGFASLFLSGVPPEPPVPPSPYSWQSGSTKLRDYFSGWGFYGTNAANTDAGKLYIFSHWNTFQGAEIVAIAKDAGGVNEVAICETGTVAGTYFISESGGSGLTGVFTWDGTQITVPPYPVPSATFGPVP